MKSKKVTKKLLSLIIASIMIVTMLPVSAFAAESDVMIEDQAEAIVEEAADVSGEVVEEAAEVPDIENNEDAATVEGAVDEIEEADPEELTGYTENLSCTAQGVPSGSDMRFDAQLTGLSVSAVVPAKRAAKGSVMTADIVDVSAYEDAVAKKNYGKSIAGLYGLELHFYDKKGKEIKHINTSDITVTVDGLEASSYFIGRIDNKVKTIQRGTEPTFTFTEKKAYTYVIAGLEDDGLVRASGEADGDGNKRFNLNDENVNIEVVAPEDAFADGVAMEANDVTSGTELDAEDGDDALVGASADEIIAAYNISFYNEEGVEQQPAKAVTVTINVPLDMTKGYELIHIADDGTRSSVEGAVFTENGVTFTADSFSVYAVIANGDTATGGSRATYKFTNENGAGSFKFYNIEGQLVDNQIIKDQEVLYDVGLPDINTNQKFLGWYVYDTATKSYTDEKIEFDTPMTVSETKTITVAPKYDTAYIVTFYVKAASETDNDVFTKKQVVVTSGTATTLDVSDLIAPSPASDDSVKTFTNWAYENGDNVQNGQIAVTEDLEMYPVFKDAHWIRFIGGPVGSGATYTEPICAYADVKICDLTKPQNPTRDGYDFVDWYTSETGGNTFDWNSTDFLTEDVVLYARWNGKPANYTVIYWYENPDDDGYSYGSSETKSGTAGQMTNATTSSSTNKQGFSVQPIEQKEINGDGTTVVNVYYKRNIYDVKFYRYGYKYTETSGTTGTQYGLVDGEYVRVYYRSSGEYWYYGNSFNNRYTGTRYTRSNSQSWNELPELTITAKYGALINNLWPSRRSDLEEEYPLSWKTSPNGSTYQTNIVTMPLEGTSFYYESLSGRYTIRAAYYTQNISGTGYSLDHNDDDRGESPYIWTITQEEFYDIPGFTPNMQKSSRIGSDPEHVSGNIYAWTLYYDRNKYSITFNTNGGPAVPTVNNIFYQADISSYAPTSYVLQETTKQSGSELLYFAGWYDNEALAGEPYDFTDKTMPANNIILYAKWEPAWYTVVIDPDHGELAEGDSTYFFKKSGAKFNAYGASRDYVESDSGTYYYHYDAFDETNPPATRLAYYGTDSGISTDGGKKYKKELSAYTLIGWFEVKDGVMSQTPYDFGEGITHDVYLKAKWRRSGFYTVVYDAVVEQDGTVIAGTNAPDDSTKYADQSESVVLGKPTAPEKYTFMGWKLGDTLYKPGDTYTVDAELADQYKVLHFTAVYKATADSEIGVTHIYWHANNGTDQTEVDENLQINANVPIRPASTFSYTGYEFVGWAKSADATESDLFLKYEDDTFKAKDGNNQWVEVTDVAADLKNPAGNDLYAVWVRQYFYIFHSSTGELEAVEMKSGVDLTTYVSGTALYGGYYSSYGAYTVTDADKKSAKDAATKKVTVTTNTYNGTSLYVQGTKRYWTKADAGRSSGKNLVPTSGAVYYLKEVPNCYLATNARWVYDWNDNDNIKAIYLLTGIDDTYYSEVGFVVTTKDEKGKIVSKLSYQQRNSDTVTTISAASLIGQRGYLGVVDASKYIATLSGGTLVSVQPYWKTIDSVKITTKGYTFENSDGEATLTKNNLKSSKNE